MEVFLVIAAVAVGEEAPTRKDRGNHGWQPHRKLA